MDRFFGRLTRAVFIAGVILARLQPNTGNTAQTLLQTQVRRPRCAMGVQLASNVIGWPRTSCLQTGLYNPPGSPPNFGKSLKIPLRAKRARGKPRRGGVRGGGLRPPARTEPWRDSPQHHRLERGGWGRRPPREGAIWPRLLEPC